MANPILVVNYDPGWPERFQRLRERIAGSLGDIAARIEHVGSTAVPGLAAKAIVDMDVLLAARELMPAAIACLADLGYIHQGDLGIAEREAFRTPAGDQPHHLYVCPPGSREFQRHVAFRDYLRTHPLEAKTYGELKRSLAVQFRDDRDAYVAGKTEFVTRIIALALAAPTS